MITFVDDNSYQLFLRTENNAINLYAEPGMVRVTETEHLIESISFNSGQSKSKNFRRILDNGIEIFVTDDNSKCREAKKNSLSKAGELSIGDKFERTNGMTGTFLGRYSGINYAINGQERLFKFRSERLTISPDISPGHLEIEANKKIIMDKVYSGFSSREYLEFIAKNNDGLIHVNRLHIPEIISVKNESDRIRITFVIYNSVTLVYSKNRTLFLPRNIPEDELYSHLCANCFANSTLFIQPSTSRVFKKKPKMPTYKILETMIPDFQEDLEIPF